MTPNPKPYTYENERDDIADQYADELDWPVFEKYKSMANWSRTHTIAEICDFLRSETDYFILASMIEARFK